MSGKALGKYYARVAKEGIIKSVLLGLLIGFCALAVLSGVYWFMGWKSAWVCLVVWAAVSAASAYAFYRWRYKPTTKEIARRVDELGLEERILTMMELEGDDSFIARKQREDAQAALNTVHAGLIKVTLSVSQMIYTAVAAVIGIGAVVVAFLTAAGVIPSGQDLMYAATGQGVVTTYVVTYVAQDEEGAILGESKQTVEEGGSTESVAAIANDGWMFVKWSDGLQVPYRQEVGVTEDMTIKVVFEKINVGNQGGLDADEPDDAPGDQEATSGKPSDEEPPDYEDGEKLPQKYEEVNQIINGETYYGSVYDESYQEAMDKLQGEEYSEDEKKIGSGYFDNIEKNEDEEDGNE